MGTSALTSQEWESRRAIELFILLLHHPEGLTNDHIVEALWPGQPAPLARRRLHSTAHRLRRVLPGILVRDGAWYDLARRESIDYDATRFTDLVRSARESRDDAPRLEFYRAAVALYRGAFFPDCYSDWCLEIRETLCRAYAAALLNLARDAETRDDEDAMHYYRLLIAADPDREEAYRGLMRAQYRTGDRAGALKTFQDCARVLRDDLQIPTPSRATLELADRIMRDK